MKDDFVYLRHILDAIKRIEEYIAQMTLEEFDKNYLVQDGVMRELEVIGEAAGHLSERTRKKMAQIQWSSVVGMRNKLIHEYFGVDLRIVWETATDYIPNLKKEIKKVMKK